MPKRPTAEHNRIGSECRQIDSNAYAMASSAEESTRCAAVQKPTVQELSRTSPRAVTRLSPGEVGEEAIRSGSGSRGASRTPHGRGWRTPQLRLLNRTPRRAREAAGWHRLPVLAAQR